MLLTVIYFIAKDNLFIFNWVDSVLAFLIEYAISNLTPLFFFIGMIIPTTIFITVNESQARGMTVTFLILYIMHAYFLEVETMKLSVGAIRYLRPAWDKEEQGDYLWPAILYWLGIKEHSGQLKTTDEEVRQEETIEQDHDSVSIDDDEIVSWTL